MNVQRNPICRSFSRSGIFEPPPIAPPAPLQLPVWPRYGESNPSKPPPALVLMAVVGNGRAAGGYDLGTLSRTTIRKTRAPRNSATTPAMLTRQPRKHPRPKPRFDGIGAIFDSASVFICLQKLAQRMAFTRLIHEAKIWRNE